MATAAMLAAGAAAITLWHTGQQHIDLDREAREARGIRDFFGNPTPADMSLAATRLTEQVNREVTACMREHGLVYQPRSEPWPDDLPPGGAVILGQPNSDYALRYGYGISTWIGVDPSSGPLAAAEAGSEDLRDEASATLLGICNERAYADVVAPLDRAEADVLPELRRLDASIRDDPRMGMATQAWSACMAERGHWFASAEQIRTYLIVRLGELGDTSRNPADDEGQQHDHGPTADDHGRHDHPDGDGVLDDGALAALQDDEMSLSRADYECHVAHVAAIEREVRAELEPAFVVANAQELRILRGDEPLSRTRPAIALVTLAAVAIGVLQTWGRRAAGRQRTKGR